ncbi:MAG TPA: hypothetical protein VF169_21930 [Albitalea sp.]|uniref:hypothetical protein n=1 Tax=Piscinibacter sp. TaxID=1903157 RepID=UPI002ED4B6F1
MDIGSIPATPLLHDASAPAWAEAPAAGDALERGPEAAVVQSLARPHAPVSEPLRPADTLLPAAQHAASEFAVPSSLLAPVALTGLQVEAAAAWPLPRPPLEPVAQARPQAEAPEPRVERDPQESAPEAESTEVPDDAVDTLVLDEADDSAWCAMLTASLRAALAARIPPQALLAAAEQWRRGRCVVLACPQGRDPAGPAWAFVLWPRRARRGDGLVLIGRRVEARLQWSASPRATPWCHVRVVKEHHPRRGRQLVALDAGANASVACEVQLGPVLARSLRWCEVCVRIDAVRRFWDALGGQWSVHVVVCAQPLVAKETPC